MYKKINYFLVILKHRHNTRTNILRKNFWKGIYPEKTRKELSNFRKCCKD